MRKSGKIFFYLIFVNPTTKIKFDITDCHYSESWGYPPGHPVVLLKVYDVIGREIATLVNEKLSAGNYETQFSINSITNNQIPSGVYFYRLQAGDYSETKRMLLIK